MELKDWITKSRNNLFNHPRVSLFKEQVELPDGRIIDDYLQMEMAEYSIVVPCDPGGRFLVQQQYKHGVRAVSLTFPAGHLEKNEDPITAAERELLEETGMRCKSLGSMGSYVINGNQGAGKAHLFLGEGAEAAHAEQLADSDDLEEQVVEWLTEAELIDAMRKRRFVIIAHALAAALALTPEVWRQT